MAILEILIIMKYLSYFQFFANNAKKNLWKQFENVSNIFIIYTECYIKKYVFPKYLKRKVVFLFSQFYSA